MPFPGIFKARSRSANTTLPPLSERSTCPSATMRSNTRKADQDPLSYVMTSDQEQSHLMGPEGSDEEDEKSPRTVKRSGTMFDFDQITRAKSEAERSALMVTSRQESHTWPKSAKGDEAYTSHQATSAIPLTDASDTHGNEMLVNPWASEMSQTPISVLLPASEERQKQYHSSSSAYGSCPPYGDDDNDDGTEPRMCVVHQPTCGSVASVMNGDPLGQNPYGLQASQVVSRRKSLETFLPRRRSKSGSTVARGGGKEPAWNEMP